MRPRDRARALAYLAQAPVIPPGVSVTDYVLLGRNPHIGFFSVEREADRDVVRQVLSRLDLVDFASRPLETLSGGERQRVTLARALAQEAPILVLDEPTSGLDLGHAQEVLELVDSLRREGGITVLSAIHDLTLASQYADALVMLNHGRVVASGPCREVLTEERLTRHYHANVRVQWDEDGGGVLISPRRPETDRR
jgi:iron complex transport system ATP-binding protein